MLSYEFKTCISNGREVYQSVEQETPEAIQASVRNAAFPESLISFLYLDLDELRPVFAELIHGVRCVIEKKDRAVSDQVYTRFCELAERHIYFELLRLDWRYRLDRAWYVGYEFPANFLRVGLLEEMPDRLALMQRQALDLIARVLDMDGEKKTVTEKMTAYYLAAQQSGKEVFPFSPQKISYELLNQEVFGEVLRPDTVYSLIDYHLRCCVQREINMRVCKNCGRYFAVTGHQGTEYCDRIADGRGRTCKDVGAVLVWAKKHGRDEVFREYRREYKKRFAWIRAGRIDPDSFYAWGEKAREKKAECDDGRITLEELSEWLKNS